MRFTFGFLLLFTCAASFAQTSNDKLIKNCVNANENIEMFVYQRLDFFGRPIQTRARNKDLYRVEIYENNTSIFETNYALFSERNAEFYTARGMALSLNYTNSGRLHLSAQDRYGRRTTPIFNTIKVNCRNL